MTSPLPSSRAPSGVPSTRARLQLRRGLVAVGLFLASLAISAGISWLRWPIPYIHDEFSYLLAADTFCEGRLTNPAHPHWEHFESIHIIQQPTYASKYPPGQGLVMALGQYLTGEPLAGVWISTALAVVAFYWMLLGWLPSRWAFVGAILLLAHPSIQLVWGRRVFRSVGL